MADFADLKMQFERIKARMDAGWDDEDANKAELRIILSSRGMFDFTRLSDETREWVVDAKAYLNRLPVHESEDALHAAAKEVEALEAEAADLFANDDPGMPERMRAQAISDRIKRPFWAAALAASGLDRSVIEAVDARRSALRDGLARVATQDCPVCMEPVRGPGRAFPDPERRIGLPCGHAIHGGCIARMPVLGRGAGPAYRLLACPYRCGRFMMSMGLGVVSRLLPLTGDLDASVLGGGAGGVYRA